MTKRKLNNKIKKIRVSSKRMFYIRFRPMAQKWFFPICALILLAGILNYEYDQRGVWVFENAKASVYEESSAEGEALSKSVGDDRNGTLAEKSASVAVPTGDTHVPIVSSAVIEAKILEAFDGDKVAVAVAKSESGLDPNAKGYNCRYGNRSTSCKPEDRHRAWSVDCGVFQINTLTKDCPEHLMDVETNIRIAKEMQSKRGWQPWVGYWNGQWKNHL